MVGHPQHFLASPHPSKLRRKISFHNYSNFSVSRMALDVFWVCLGFQELAHRGINIAFSGLVSLEEAAYMLMVQLRKCVWPDGSEPKEECVSLVFASFRKSPHFCSSTQSGTKKGVQGTKWQGRGRFVDDPSLARNCDGGGQAELFDKLWLHDVHVKNIIFHHQQ